MQKKPSQGFFKESAVRNIADFTRKYLCHNLLFDKVKLCRSSTSLKTSFSAGVFLCILRNLLQHFFVEHDQETASDYSIINSKRRIGKQNLDYDTKTKAYVPFELEV